MLLRILIFIAFINNVFAQEKFALRQDLRQQWLKYEGDAYSPVEESDMGKISTIYFNVDLNDFSQDHFQIESGDTFFLFINGKLIQQYQGLVILKVDSLARSLALSSLAICIHQPNLHDRDMKTWIVSNRPIVGEINMQKPDSSLKDFVIVSGLILIVFFVIITRLHTKLASDYFSVTRIFSLREGDDAQPYARLVGSSNILFYVFFCLLLGFYLMIIFQYLPDHYSLSLKFRASDFWMLFWQWIKLSTFLLVMCFIKIFIIFLLSNLFGMKSLAGIHFFNWVRLLLIVCASLSVVLFIYYISRGHDPGFYVVSLMLVIAALTVWIIIGFLKFNARIEHSMFHLFSYICATEIIPLLITVKVLFH